MEDKKKTRRYEKMFLVVDLNEEGWGVRIRRMTRGDIEALAKRVSFDMFTVIDGEVVKPFCKRFDPGKLR